MLEGRESIEEEDAIEEKGREEEEFEEEEEEESVETEVESFEDDDEEEGIVDGFEERAAEEESILFLRALISFSIASIFNQSNHKISEIVVEDLVQEGANNWLPTGPTFWEEKVLAEGKESGNCGFEERSRDCLHIGSFAQWPNSPHRWHRTSERER